MIYLLDAVATNLDLVYLVLACVGIVIILGCIGAYMFGYGGNLRDKVQEISALGANMKISVITFFILVGIVLIIPLVWTSFSDAVKSLTQTQQSLLTQKQTAEKERDELKLLLSQANAKRTRDQIYFLELDGFAPRAAFKKEDLEVVYSDFNSGAPQMLDHDLMPGSRKRIRVLFKDINDETEFASLEVIYKPTDQRWIIENFKPCRPLLTLKKSTNE